MATSIKVGTLKEIFNRTYTFIDPGGTGIGEWRLTNVDPTDYDYKGIYTILPVTSQANQDTGVVTLGFNIESLAHVDNLGSFQDPNEVYRGLSMQKQYLPRAKNGLLDITAIPPVDSLQNDNIAVIKFDISLCDRLIPKDNSKRARRERAMNIKFSSYNKGSAVGLKAKLPMEVIDDGGNSETVSFDIVNLPSI